MSADSNAVRTWPENVRPTPEQFADYLALISREERVEIAAVLLDAMDRADRCFLADHEGRLERLAPTTNPAAAATRAELTAEQEDA